MNHKLTNLLTHYRHRNPNPSQQQTDLETVLRFLVNYIIQLETEITQLKTVTSTYHSDEAVFLKEQVLQLTQQLAQLSTAAYTVVPPPKPQYYASVEAIPRNLAKPKTTEELINDIPNIDSGFGVSQADLQSYLNRPRVTAADIVLSEEEKQALQTKKPDPGLQYTVSPLVFKVLYIASVCVTVMAILALALAIAN